VVGQCRVELSARADAELGEHLAQVPLDRACAEEELGADLGIRVSVPGFTAIRVEVTVAGPETEERYAELAAAVDAHCPVLDLFQNPVPVSCALHLADPAANPA
jgi:OsmC-like protein